MSHSYEKSMFFIPNRLFVSEDELHVSFNIAVIPSDMDVTSIVLHIPLPKRNMKVQIEIRETAGSWDEKSIVTVSPLLSDTVTLIDVSSDMEEALFEVTHLADEWRFNSFDNHGVHIKLLAIEDLSLTDDKPPYLLITTV